MILNYCILDARLGKTGRGDVPGSIFIGRFIARAVGAIVCMHLSKEQSYSVDEDDALY
jgi:hypothetical protein